MAASLRPPSTAPPQRRTVRGEGGGARACSPARFEAVALATGEHAPHRGVPVTLPRCALALHR
jgi:hypothetical protein